MMRQKTTRMVATIGILSVVFFTGFLNRNIMMAQKIELSVYPLKLTDSYQRVVTIPQEPLRIVSAAPNITEIVFALGRQAKLVGRTNYCNYPAAAARVESIGGLLDPNIEKIVQLKPDLVIASTHFKKDVLIKLDNLGIPVIVLYGEESFDGAFDTIVKVGRVLNANRQAVELVAKMRKKVDYITTKVRGVKKPKVYYVVGYGKSGDFTAGKDTFIGSLIAMAGGDNMANDTKGWQYSIEKLLEKDPEILICSKYYGAKKGIETTVGYQDLTAVKKKRVFEIDNNLLDRQGPRLADGLADLAKILHPEVFGSN